MKSTSLAVSAAVTGIGVALAGCSSGGQPAALGGAGHKAAASTKSAGSHATATASPMPTTSGTIGDACARLPATGMGSISGMATVPVATAVSHDPQLTTLSRAIHTAGLTGTLNSASAITLFAPDNSAFHALGSENLKVLMSSKAALVKLLEYHTVKGRVSPADLAAGKPLTTRAGLPVLPVKSGSVYKVNGARVTCGNLRTANGTIYIVNKVLIPIA